MVEQGTRSKSSLILSDYKKLDRPTQWTVKTALQASKDEGEQLSVHEAVLECAAHLNINLGLQEECYEEVIDAAFNHNLYATRASPCWGW